MRLGRWKLFGGYFRTYSSQPYKETVEAAEHLAAESLLILERKSEEERRQIFERATELTERFWDAAEKEPPLVVAFALLTALRTHHQLLQTQAKQIAAMRQNS
ncbi:MAG TPA: hypothetical protein VGH51_12115 [Candidatus Angelobacter sp.]